MVPHMSFSGNKSVVINAYMLKSTFNERHNSIEYHSIRWDVGANE